MVSAWGRCSLREISSVCSHLLQVIAVFVTACFPIFLAPVVRLLPAGKNSHQFSSRCFWLYCYRVRRAACLCVCLQGQNYRKFLAGVSVPTGTATANVFAGVSVLCWYVFACRDRTLTNCLADVSGCIATVCGVLLASVFAFKDRTTANFLAGVFCA